MFVVAYVVARFLGSRTIQETGTNRASWRWVLVAGVPGLAVALLLGAFGHGLPGPALTGLLVLLMGWQWWYSGGHERRRAAATT